LLAVPLRQAIVEAGPTHVVVHPICARATLAQHVHLWHLFNFKSIACVSSLLLAGNLSPNHNCSLGASNAAGLCAKFLFFPFNPQFIGCSFSSYLSNKKKNFPLDPFGSAPMLGNFLELLFLLRLQVSLSPFLFHPRTVARPGPIQVLC
jgi:hypothetical protein